MQKTIVDMVFLSLFIFLFAAMSLSRNDLRLRLWVAGWVCVLPHFIIELWQPASQFWQNVQSCVVVDTLVLAGICFMLSTAIKHPRHGSVWYLAPALAVATFIAIDMAIIGAPAWLLAVAVAAYVFLSIVLTSTVRTPRPAFALSVTAMSSLAGILMFEGILTGTPQIVVYIILAEVFLVAAADFWISGWQRTLALRTMSIGLAVWGAVFPLSFWVQLRWPDISIESELWNLPKLCVSIGMILIILEEDNRAARAFAEDYRLLFDNNPQALWITEISTRRFLAANQVALDMHGYSREEFLTLKLTEILPPEIKETVLTHLTDSRLRAHNSSRHLRKDGSVLHLDVNAYDIVFEGKPCRFVMAVDATVREVLEEQLDRQAGMDQLTGLPNRLLFSELLTGALHRACEGHEKLAVLSIDIDRFKRVNDLYGMRVGDESIERIAATLAARLRSMDIVARTGGDEFAIVLTGLKSSFIAEQTVNELLELFAQPFVIQGYKLQLDVSIGAAIGPDDASDPVALWRGAESACNQAKSAVGPHVLWLSPELNRAAEEQIELEAYMRSHINDGGFKLVYQPIYAMDGAVHGLEALLRLDHPGLGPISPVRLIPIAEESGLIVPLGQWIIEEACRQLLVWSSQGVAIVPVAINVSGLQLMHEDFAQRLTATLMRYSIDPRLVHIEVTESAAMRNIAGVTERMAALSAQGIVFSIDDFGTGYSSLARLAQLGASILKTDRSFMNPTCSAHAHSILQAIITMAHALGRIVVAEGVETTHQLDCLRELGCDLLQGFLLSPPVAPDRVPVLIAAKHPALTTTQDSCSNDSLHLVAHAGD